MPLPMPGRRSRGCALAFALLLTLLPADALAARSWQPPIPPPPGFSFGGLGPAVQFDAEGDVSVTVKPSAPGAYQYAVRPHSGPLSAPQSFPGTLGEGGITTRHTATNAAGDLLMWSSSVVGFRPAPIYSTAFGPTTFTKVQSLMGGTGVVRHAVITPAGAAFAQTLKGDPSGPAPTSQTFVIHRPADPNASFDESQKVELPPAAPDSGTEPLGIVADPGGSVTAVYRSLPSLRVMQASAAGPNQPFAAATELVLSADPGQWQASAITRFAASYNGHAILVWGTDRTAAGAHKTEIWASRRAPGGAFGAREPVADLDPGHTESDPGGGYGPRGVAGGASAPQLFPVALDSGATLLAFNEITEGDDCSNPGLADFEQGAALTTRAAGGAWSSPTPLGPSGNLVYAQVEAIAGAGESVALASAEVTRPAPCETSGPGIATSVRLGQGTALGAATLLSTSGGLGGTGIALNPAGDAGLVLGSPRVLRIYEDAGTAPEPPGPEPEDPGNPPNPGDSGGGAGAGGGGSGSDPGTPPPGKGQAPPAKGGVPGGIKLGRPPLVSLRARQPSFSLSAYCDAAAGSACAVSVLAATKPAPIKPARGKVSPGQTKALKAYLTPAGIALLRQKGSLATKVRIVVKAGAAEAVATKAILIKKG